MKQSELTKKYLVNFEEKIPVLVEYFTRYYGEEYRKLIKQRLEEVYVVFKGDDMQFVKASESSVLAKSNVDKITSLVSGKVDLVNTSEDSQLDTWTNPLMKSNSNNAKVLSKEETAYKKAYDNTIQIENRIQMTKEFDNNFLDVFSAFCIETSGKPLSENDRKKILKLFDDHDADSETRMRALFVICITNACGIDTERLHNEQPVVKAFDVLNKEIDFGPFGGGKKEFKEAIAYAFSKTLDLEEKLNDVYAKGRLTEDTIEFFYNNLYERVVEPQTFLAYILSSKNNFHMPVQKNNYQGSYNVVSYNVNTLADNVIIHELDHAVMQYIELSKNNRKSYTVYQGIKKSVVENGEYINSGNDFAQELVEKLKAMGKESLVEKFYPKIYDEKGFHHDYDTIANDIKFFDEVCTDYRTSKIVEMMRRDGVVIYNNREDEVSEYSKAFAGCDNLFENAMPFITACTVESKLDLLIDAFGAENFIQLIYHVKALSEVDMTKCGANMVDIYYRYISGIYVLGEREFTEEEEKYIKHTEAINALVEALVDKVDKSDDLLKNFWSPIK